MANKQKWRVLELTQGFVAIISACDYRRANKYSWHVHKSRGSQRKPGQPYARATINGQKVYLHRFIMEAPDSMHVDHINHQTLDCRRDNLEVVCHRTNLARRRSCNGN